jgi:hypothetical protein
MTRFTVNMRALRRDGLPLFVMLVCQTLALMVLKLVDEVVSPSAWNSRGSTACDEDTANPAPRSRLIDLRILAKLVGLGVVPGRAHVVVRPGMRRMDVRKRRGIAWVCRWEQ